MSITIYQVEQFLEQCAFKPPIPTEEESALWFDPNYIPLTLLEAKEGASKKCIGMFGEANGMYGKTISDKQKKAVGNSAKERFTGIPKWYKTYTPVMVGKDNPRAKSISGDGVMYDCIADCQKALGFKNHNAIRYRLNHPKWVNWFYV